MSTTRWLEPVRAAALVAILAAVTACTMQEESGPDTTQQRTVAAFDAIDLRGAAQLDVLAGAAPSLTLAGKPGAIDAVITRVDGSTLIIENKGRGFWQTGSGKVQVRVTTPTLASLEISGAGQVTVSGMAGGELKLLLQGAAQIEASGNVDILDARLNGASNADLSHLVARSATVVVNGAGNLEVNATGSLVATVNGVGNVSYLGKPADVKTAINGVGSIAPR